MNLEYKEIRHEQSHSARPAWLDIVLEYMLNHFADELTLDDLANSVGISKFNFCRQFHRYQGMPPLKWLWRFRAILASEILKLPIEWSIQDIAYSTGFSSCAHFSRIFKELFEQTPSAYRSKIRTQLRASSLYDQSAAAALLTSRNCTAIASAAALAMEVL